MSTRNARSPARKSPKTPAAPPPAAAAPPTAPSPNTPSVSAAASSPDTLTVLTAPVEWPAGEATRPRGTGPIQVQVAARFYYIKDAENLHQAYTCRFSLHLSWVDKYYRLANQPADPDDIVHYSTHPEIGQKASNFPERDKSMHGVEIERRVDAKCLPRWTPEIKFFDSEGRPTVIREEYAADRSSGVVTCYFEGTGTFAQSREVDSDTQVLILSIGSQHRKKHMEFVKHERVKSEVFASPISDWHFRGKPVEADMTNETPGGSRHMYPKVSFKISASRNTPYMQRCAKRVGNFVLNETSGPLIVFVATAIVTCTLKTYGICESSLTGALTLVGMC